MDFPSATCFSSVSSLHAKGYVVVPSARIFLAERQEDPFMRKILTPCELLSLGVDPSTSDKPDKNSDGSFSGN